MRQVISYDNRYFQDKYQGMPKDGYTAMFEKMLDHPDIEVRGTDGQLHPLDLSCINQRIDTLAKKAMRVIAFGYSEEPLQENCISGNLVLINFSECRCGVVFW